MSSPGEELRCVRSLLDDAPDVLTGHDLLDWIVVKNRSVQLVAAHKHPLRREAGPYPPDLLPLQATSKYLSLANAQAEIIEVDRPWNVDPNISQLCFGSPISNVFSRQYLGYTGSALRLRRTTGPNLPYAYVDNVSDLKLLPEASTRCKLFWGGKPWAEPNWSLDAPDGKMLVPHVDRDGFLRTDILVITSLPSEHAEGIRKVIIGGLHPVATAAFLEVLQNKNLLDDAARKIEDPTNAFQIVFLIEVEHSNRESHVANIEHYDTRQFAPWDNLQRPFAHDIIDKEYKHKRHLYLVPSMEAPAAEVFTKEHDPGAASGIDASSKPIALNQFKDLNSVDQELGLAYVSERNLAAEIGVSTAAIIRAARKLRLPIFFPRNVVSTRMDELRNSATDLQSHFDSRAEKASAGRAAKIPPENRSQLASDAANARWSRRTK